MEPEGSVPPSTGPYPDPDRSNPRKIRQLFFSLPPYSDGELTIGENLNVLAFPNRGYIYDEETGRAR
jgi:hypothetical protein